MTEILSRIVKDDGSNFFQGDDLQVQRDISNVEATDPIAKAWLTIKRTQNQPDPGPLQKIVTTSATPSGQVVQDGSVSNGDGKASLYFALTGTETAALGSLWDYWYDIQVLTGSGKRYTPEKGRVRFDLDVTKATA